MGFTYKYDDTNDCAFQFPAVNTSYPPVSRMRRHMKSPA